MVWDAMPLSVLALRVWLMEGESIKSFFKECCLQIIIIVMAPRSHTACSALQCQSVLQRERKGILSVVQIGRYRHPQALSYVHIPNPLH